MEEVGAQVAPSIFMHQTLSSRYCEPPSLAKKRHLSYLAPSLQQHHHQQSFDNSWNPNQWDWDSTRFVAKPLDSDSLKLPTPVPGPKKIDQTFVKKNSVVTHESLDLNLGGGLMCVEEPVFKSSKKGRSGSPGGTTYPMCQVDNCKEDLSSAKDYHRRHKVCELHSKSTKAIVGKQMQRFCQQCSRLDSLCLDKWISIHICNSKLFFFFFLLLGFTLSQSLMKEREAVDVG